MRRAKIQPNNQHRTHAHHKGNDKSVLHSSPVIRATRLTGCLIRTVTFPTSSHDGILFIV